MKIRPYSIIVQFHSAFYEIILWLTNEEMEAWDKEVDLEWIHCITDMSHQIKNLKCEVSGATKM